MKAVKLSLIISFLISSSGYLLFSKENKNKNDIKSEEEIKSIIKNFATIDNRLDNIILNINTENISDEIMNLKKDIDKSLIKIPFECVIKYF